MEHCTQINLLLIGKSGNGKSATGNSILRRKCFRTSGSALSVTNKVDVEVGKFVGVKLKVVDAPGVCDNSLESKEGAELVVNCLQQAIYLCPDGYNAFALVVKFGSRFTGEELATLSFLKQVFGENFVRDHCILILSGGDIFEYEVKSEGERLKDWCSRQTGTFKQLLDECGNRIVLFDNFTKDSYVKRKQILKLLKEIAQLGSRGERYTDMNFRNARHSREKLKQENKFASVKEESFIETSYLLDKLEKVQSSDDHKMKISPLEKILQKDSQLLKALKESDGDTGTMEELIQRLKSIGAIANDEKSKSIRLAAEEEKVRRQKEELQAEKLKLEQQRKEMERMTDIERQKAIIEEEKHRLEIDKMRKLQEEREARLRKEALEAKEAQARKLEQEEERHRENRESDMLTNAADFASSFVPYAKPLFSVGKGIYNWWYGK
ncbi:uncharacterized protein LOC106070425 [Biomphalaria glabrata]|uniref:Uncharacterized protein LOC106070425 n=1 Tax=Biomphalaria glabrata TaxID=6526 RepID=A0A9W2YN51_BIOGL|nr:uncharacterized protein LOC106070425 [Biomphalaria glabrata]